MFGLQLGLVSRFFSLRALVLSCFFLLHAYRLRFYVHNTRLSFPCILTSVSLSLYIYLSLSLYIYISLYLYICLSLSSLSTFPFILLMPRSSLDHANTNHHLLIVTNRSIYIYTYVHNRLDPCICVLRLTRIKICMYTHIYGYVYIRLYTD